MCPIESRSVAPAIAGTLLGLVACANPVNRHTYERYVVAGDQAAESGDLQLAKLNYSRAVTNAEVGNLSEPEMARAMFKYARILGNLCEHDEAERWFIEANRMNEKANGAGSEETYVTLAEIAQLNYDIGRYDEAVPYFGKSLAIAERFKLDTRDPASIGSFADVYADYADALAKTGDHERSKQMTSKSMALRTMTTEKEQYTRYPRACE
jgi:tetratricopeptide (TPR) repeat protein